MAEQAPFYIFTAFVFAYGIGTLKVSRDLLLVAVLAASVVSFFSIPLAGHLSDRFGRRRMYIIGAVADRRVRLGLLRACWTRWCRSGSSSRSCCR